MTSHSSKLTQGYEHRPICFQNHTCSPCPAATHRSDLRGSRTPSGLNPHISVRSHQMPYSGFPATLKHFLPWVHLTELYVAHAVYVAERWRLWTWNSLSLVSRISKDCCTLHRDPTCIFSAYRWGLLTSPHLQAFPGPPPRWPPSSFPTRPLWELSDQLSSPVSPRPPLSWTPVASSFCPLSICL